MNDFDRNHIALLAVVITLIGIGINTLTTLRINRRTLKAARDMVKSRERHERGMVVEKRIHDRKMPRDDARVEIAADLKELQRHAGENWFVLSTMLARIEHPYGTPFVQHYAKLAYPTDLKSFKAENEHLFDEPMRSNVQKIRMMIRNCNIEVVEAIEIARTRSAEDVEKVTRDLLVKAGVIYTIWTAGMPDLLGAAQWSHHGAIESARYEEIRGVADPHILKTLNVTPEPFGEKPLTMYSRFKGTQQ